MGSIMVVVGGQFGSEGKGAITAALARKATQPLGVIRVGGSNAGHTVWDDDDNVWKLRHIPTPAVVCKGAKLLLGPGSEVDGTVLAQEIKTLEEAGFDILDRLTVDQSATMILPEYSLIETAGGLVDRIGSTGKGVGAARAARIMREAITFGGLGDTKHVIDQILWAGGTVLVEGTQGYGLGLHTEYYPQCTSSDCDAAAMMAMAGVVPWHPYSDQLEIWIVFRSLPIRVAGNSGPLENETSWGALNLPEEFTTVTKKVRRVGEWDADLATKALAANGGPGEKVKMVLTGLDLIVPGLTAMRQKWTQIDDLKGSEEAWSWIRKREDELGDNFSAIGIGPGQGDLLWR